MRVTHAINSINYNWNTAVTSKSRYMTNKLCSHEKLSIINHSNAVMNDVI